MLALGLIRQEFFFKRVPSTVSDSVAHFPHERLVIVHVMPSQKHRTQHFVSPKQMLDIAARMLGTGNAITSWVDGFQRCFVHGVAHIELTKARKGAPCAARTCGKHTIKHVNATFDGPHQVVWCANAHQVTRLVDR